MSIRCVTNKCLLNDAHNALDEIKGTCKDIAMNYGLDNVSAYLKNVQIPDAFRSPLYTIRGSSRGTYLAGNNVTLCLLFNTAIYFLSYFLQCLHRIILIITSRTQSYLYDRSILFIWYFCRLLQVWKKHYFHFITHAPCPGAFHHLRNERIC